MPNDNSTESQLAVTLTHKPASLLDTVRLSWIALLASLTALGPLSTDMYLPALAHIANDMQVSTDSVSLSMPAFFIGLVVGQLAYGAISDRVGRKLPLYFGLIIYVLASCLCAMTDHVSGLIAYRMLQAIGGCVGVVMARAALRDTLPPIQTAQAFSILILIMGLAPILAPMVGAALLSVGSWRWIFWILAGVGGLNLLAVHYCFTETLPKDRREQQPMGQILWQYGQVLGDSRFNLAAIGGGCLMGALFVYLTLSPELLIDAFGLSPSQYSWIFALNAIGFIGLTQLNGRLTRRFSLVKLLRVGAVIQTCGSTVLLSLGLLSSDNLILVLMSVFVIISAIGLTTPNSSAIALAFQSRRAGLASAMLGALQFLLGILGGMVAYLLPVSSLLRLGLVMFVLMSLGTWLVYKIPSDLDLSNLN